MLKKLVKYGNSYALVIDRSIMELLDIQEGSAVKLKTDGRSLIVTPQSSVPADAVPPTGQELIDRMLVSMPIHPHVNPVEQAIIQSWTQRVEAIAENPEQAKDFESWMPGTEKSKQLQAAYSELMKKYQAHLRVFESLECKQKMEAWAEKYKADLTTPQAREELMALRASLSPEIAQFDQEMMEIPIKLGMPKQFMSAQVR